MFSAIRIAILVPCYNEAIAIEKVIRDFRKYVPEADVYVYDNNSNDRTSEVAQRAGAIVRREERQGKGNVVRRMFSDVDADVYVLVDGDGTYSAETAPTMIARLLNDNLDMVVGARIHNDSEAYRAGHVAGNMLLTGCVTWLFGKSFSDILSGYRVFSRRFVKSFPALSRGFEIETELTVHALEIALPVCEVQTPYGTRPSGSVSKLSTYRDGIRITRVILDLFRHEKPLQFFGSIAAVLALTSLVLGVPILLEWLATGLVLRFPTAILATGIMILAFLLLTAGLVLETVTRGRQEMRRLAYLQIPLTRRDAALHLRMTPEILRVEGPKSDVIAN